MGKSININNAERAVRERQKGEKERKKAGIGNDNTILDNFIKGQVESKVTRDNLSEEEKINIRNRIHISGLRLIKDKKLKITNETVKNLPKRISTEISKRVAFLQYKGKLEEIVNRRINVSELSDDEFCKQVDEIARELKGLNIQTNDRNLIQNTIEKRMENLKTKSQKNVDDDSDGR